MRLLLVLILAAGLSACNSLSSLLFYPHKSYYQQPAELGLDAQWVRLSSDNETLFCWFIESKKKPRATILYLHGNGENISTHINSIAWLADAGFRIFMLDYRGYGASTGDATLASAFTDIKAAHTWLSTHDDLPLILLGQSMGGALAITYAAMTKTESVSQRPFEAIVAESAPASWPQIAREAMRSSWLTYLLQIPASFIPSKYDPEDRVALLDPERLLIIHSIDDQIVPINHARQLVRASGNQALLIETNGPHIGSFRDPRIRAHVENFITQRLP